MRSRRHGGLSATIGRVLLVALLVGGAWLGRVDTLSLFLYLSYAIAGGLLAIQRPRQVLGWLLVWLAFGFIGTTTQPDVDVAALLAGGGTWADFLAVWVPSWAGYATFTGYVALTLVFPSGHLPAGGRGRALLLLTVCVIVTVLPAIAPLVPYTPADGVSAVLVPNRFAVAPGLPIWSVIPFEVLIAPVALSLVIGVAWMLRRYRRAVGIERLQLRWLVAALTAVVVALLFGLFAVFLFQVDDGTGWLPALVAYPTVPIAIYVAVMRHRLYEIDRVISRTLGWVLVTVAVAAVFAAVVIGLQAALAPVTGDSTLAVAASTLTAAALFQPLRARIQRGVDRRFNRGRLDAERVVAGFAGQLRDEVDLRALRTTLVAAAVASVEPDRTGVWLRSARGAGARGRSPVQAPSAAGG